MALSQTENSKISKSFGPCQPARTAQADIGRYVLQMHLAPFSLSTAHL